MSVKLIHRPTYENLLANLRDNGFIKVLMGVRRCGKSSLLQLLCSHLLESGVPSANIYLRRLDTLDVPLDPDAQWLLNDVMRALGHVVPDVPVYVLIDEVQEIEGWERVVRKLAATPNVDIYLTGSNSKVFSSDLATHLSGRYVTVDVYPLSFDEYLDFARQCGGDSWKGLAQDELFSRYVRYGGMPSLFSLRDFDEVEVARVLQGVTDTVVLNDVAQRFAIRDIALLQRLVRYVFSTSGNLFSTRNVVNALASSGRKPSVEVVDNYLEGLKRANVLLECEQAGIAGKEVLRPQRKFYPVDSGLRNLQTGFAPKDLGFQLEDVVCVELARRGFNVSVGSLPKGEVDFVARRESDVRYIQVTESMVDDTTYERELAPFAHVGDSFPKLVLTGDHLRDGITSDGARIQNIEDWLLQA